MQGHGAKAALAIINVCLQMFTYIVEYSGTLPVLQK